MGISRRNTVERTTTALDDTRRLGEHGIARPQSLDVRPDLIAGVVRVDGRYARRGVREGFRQAADVVPVNLDAGRDDKRLVANLAARASGD